MKELDNKGFCSRNLVIEIQFTRGSTDRICRLTERGRYSIINTLTSLNSLTPEHIGISCFSSRTSTSLPEPKVGVDAKVGPSTSHSQCLARRAKKCCYE